MTKEQVITSLQELPNSFEPEQLIERIIALLPMADLTKGVYHHSCSDSLY